MREKSRRESVTRESSIAPYITTAAKGFIKLARGQHSDGSAPHGRGPHQAQHRPEPV
jgi:hypothetical protein